MLRVPHILAIVALAVVACDAGGPAPEPEELAAMDDWAQVDPADDVFADMAPGMGECDPHNGLALESFGGEAAFEVRTDFCNDVTVTQALLTDLHAGDTVEVRLWHYELWAPAPGEGVVALAVDGEPVWEDHIAIPGPSELVKDTFTVDADVPAGAPLQFHVHNHGINTWDLLELVTSP